MRLKSVHLRQGWLRFNGILFIAYVEQSEIFATISLVTMSSFNHLEESLFL